MSERFPSAPRQETTSEDTADNDALREAYLQEATEQEEPAEDADTAALREAYAQEATNESEATATDANQPESLSLEDQLNLPAISDEARNVDLPENYSGTPSSETADADTAALREAYLQEETQKQATESADNAALREAYTQEVTRENEKAAVESNTTSGGRRINAYARKPETTSSARPEAAAAPSSTEDPRLSTENLNRAYFGDPLKSLETRGEGATNDVLKNLLAQNQELANAVRDLTLRLNRLTVPGASIANRAPERTPTPTIDYDSGSDSGSIPEYQRAHTAEMDMFAKAEAEMVARKENAETRKAERKRIRGLEKQAKKAERKESRSEWRILAGKKARAIGRAVMGKLSGKPSGWTTGKNAAAATKLN